MAIKLKKMLGRCPSMAIGYTLFQSLIYIYVNDSAIKMIENPKRYRKEFSKKQPSSTSAFSSGF